MYSLVTVLLLISSHLWPFYGYIKCIRQILNIWWYKCGYFVNHCSLPLAEHIDHCHKAARVGKYCDIFENTENIRYFRYRYKAFAHTLVKLYEIYNQIIVCVCVLCILGKVLLSFTLHCCREVQSDRSCPTLRNC